MSPKTWMRTVYFQRYLKLEKLVRLHRCRLPYVLILVWNSTYSIFNKVTYIQSCQNIQFQISLKVNHSHPSFWTHLSLNCSRLTKFIQKIDPNSRMPRIFNYLWIRQTSQLFTHKQYVISRNKLARLGTPQKPLTFLLSSQ